MKKYQQIASIYFVCKNVCKFFPLFYKGLRTILQTFCNFYKQITNIWGFFNLFLVLSNLANPYFMGYLPQHCLCFLPLPQGCQCLVFLPLSCCTFPYITALFSLVLTGSNLLSLLKMVLKMVLKLLFFHIFLLLSSYTTYHFIAYKST